MKDDFIHKIETLDQDNYILDNGFSELLARKIQAQRRKRRLILGLCTLLAGMTSTALMLNFGLDQAILQINVEDLWKNTHLIGFWAIICFFGYLVVSENLVDSSSP